MTVCRSTSIHLIMKKAVIFFKKALQINPDFIEARDGLGNVLVRIGQPRKALEHWRQGDYGLLLTDSGAENLTDRTPQTLIVR